MAPARVQAQTINSTNRGWYLDSGIHNASNNNYVTGNVNGAFFANWFLFDVPSVRAGQQYTAATFRLYTSDGYTEDTDETYALHDYSGSRADLVGNNGNGNGTAIYSDLTTGADYGSVTIGSAQYDTYVDIPLSSAALADINAMAGGQFVLGGTISSLDNDEYTYEYLFGGSGGSVPNDGQTQLILSQGGGGGGGA